MPRITRVIKTAQVAGLAIAMFGMGLSPAQAQRRRSSAEKAAPKLSAAELSAAQKGSEPINVLTRDGVYLTGRFWKPDESNKETPVVMLLHMRGRDQNDWAPYARYLCDKGFAVATFDFRGHGDSKQVNPDQYVSPRDALRGMRRPSSDNRVERIDEETEFRNGRELAMLVNDIDAIKEFLIEQNNAGRINVQRLGVVAGGPMASALATHFAAREYASERGWVKTGGDLATLILISPTLNYSGLTAVSDFDKSKRDEERLPVFIVSNDDRSEKKSADQLRRKLWVPFLGKGGKASGRDRPESGMMLVKSKKSGSDLFRPPVENVDELIHGYLHNRLVDKRSFQWRQRTKEEDAGGGFGSQR
ncbi:Alpha/beta hydrolase family protein [Planctomycetes bacterium Pan216]|uniref:Alpha/beta hydrolase family protein n=1 Tax=Kolteria novifilia TaxID=2527975 RepID=A0A518B9Q3_9BACT|nr:Alpha/beta hydrolase family protein [Planctomycetes bacterium Pan216]